MCGHVSASPTLCANRQCRGGLEELAASISMRRLCTPLQVMDCYCTAGGPVIEWDNLNLAYKSESEAPPCKELTVTVAHEPGSGQLWLTDICQQEIIVRDSESNAVVFRQPSHQLLMPGSCVTFYKMASGATGFDLVEDNGGWLPGSDRFTSCLAWEGEASGGRAQ